MNMSDRNKNLDAYLEANMKSYIQAETSPDFTLELMKKVQLEKEFAREDVKTSRIAKFVIGGFISILASFVILFSFLFNSNKDQKDISFLSSTFLSSTIDKFSKTIQDISIFSAENLGFAFTYQAGMIILLVMVCIFLFSFADKFMFKGYK